MPSYCQRASERISRTEREEERGAGRREGRTRRTAERKVPLSSKLEGGAARIVFKHLTNLICISPGDGAVATGTFRF